LGAIGSPASQIRKQLHFPIQERIHRQFFSDLSGVLPY